MLQKKYCSWSRLISTCSQYIWPRLLDCSYAADSFSGRGIVVQICSWLLCGWAELLGAFDGMNTIVQSKMQLTKAVMFLTAHQEQSRVVGGGRALMQPVAWCSLLLLVCLQLGALDATSRADHLWEQPVSAALDNCQTHCALALLHIIY